MADISVMRSTVASAGHQASHSLPAWIYQNEEFLALEREEFFMKSWQLVCHQSNIHNVGDYHTIDLMGEPVVVVRGKDGEVRGFFNVCRHRAARLLDDVGSCPGKIRCPYHAWVYELDGALSGVPYRREFEHFNQADHGLIPVELESFLGFIFVRVVPGGPSLADMLAPIKSEMALYCPEGLKPFWPVGTGRISVNWKNATDNYIDAQHVRAAHPGLNSLFGKHYDLTHVAPGLERLSGSIDERKSRGLWAKLYADLLPEASHLPTDYQRRWLYFMVGGNIAFNLYPDYVEFMQYLPVSPTTTIIRDAAYVLADDRREMKAARFLNRKVNRQVYREDVDLITRVQAGMASRSFLQGPLGKNESCLRGFAAEMRSRIPVSTLANEPALGTVALRNAELLTSGN